MSVGVGSLTGNFGGKISDYQQGIKQFYVGVTGNADWIYKRLVDTGTIVITPANRNHPVVIDNDLTIKQDLYVDGSLHVYGSIYNPSDAKLKENIEVISSEQIDNLFNLNPINFSYKNDRGKSKHFGLLAQDVEKVFPELVKNDKDYKSVNYQELLPIMLAKMKQMQLEIDELKQQLKK